jgi:alpha-tubulin suppressor-like RCC1 family protein
MFGSGESGQLGTGKRSNEINPVLLPTGSDKVTQIECGPTYTLFLVHTGKVYAMGANNYG